MTPDQLSAKVDTIVTTFDDAFTGQVTQTQTALFEQMQLLLNRLELSPDGTIIQNQANRKLLAQVDTYYNKAFNQSGYYEALGQSVNSIGAITGANSQYFNFILDTFTPSAQYITNLQKQTIGELQSLLANEGLEAMMKQPILNILNQNINSGASFTDLLKQVREFTLGTDKLQGQLMRYSRQITTDSLFNFNRALQEAVSQNVGLNYYFYSGGRDKDSRPFCIDRVSKYYHKREVEEWASLEWEGKRRGTTASSIFIYAGGYSCKHTIIAVSEITVPKSVIKRAKAKGFV